jgi:glycosyltransferase involved in cell wall biosynthesis
VLEAAACGIPVICTSGGSTDDFVADAFCRTIDSRRVPCKYHDADGFQLDPSLEHLIALMSAAIEDAAWRTRAAEAGPRHAAAGFTWDAVVSLLVEKLYP